jgi:hypothetical protein
MRGKLRRFAPAAAASLVFALPAAAQTPTDLPSGLDALDESRVLTEIAGRELEALLRHALDRQGIPEAERSALLSSLALGRLTAGETIPADERQRLVLDVVGGVSGLLEQPIRPGRERERADLLIQQAQTLIDRGVGEEVRLLEYFGDNPERRRYVRPVADAVAEMLRVAGGLYGDAADDVERLITSSTDPRIRLARELRGLSQQAQQLTLFADYYRLLGLDPDDPERLNLGDRLIRRVRPLDREGNPQRAFVRQFLGKIALARGNREGRELARESFEAALADEQPVTQAFDSYFGRVVAEAAAGEIDGSREQLERFRSWFSANEAELPGRAPLVLVAAYRVEDAASRNAADASARREAADQARDALTRLIDQYDGYRGVVTGQLLATIDEETDLTTLSPLLLDAIVDKGRAEAAQLAANERADPNRPVTPVDRARIDQGVAAARELLARAQADPSAVDPSIRARNAFVLAAMLQVLDRRLEAAQAYLISAQLPGADADQRLSAYRRALGIVDAIRASGEGDQTKADRLEADLLPVLVDEYGDTRRAFDLANRLHRLGDLQRAVEYYAKVPDEDPRRPEAQFLRTVAQAARVNQLPASSPIRVTLIEQIPDEGDRALTALDAAIRASTGERRQAYRERAVQLRLTLARLALNDADDAARALSYLEEIESAAADLADGELLIAEALPLRFQATAAEGRIDEATRDLLTLLENSDTRQGLAFIGQFRQTLDRAFDRASVRQDRDAMRRVMQTRAAVTPRLAEWIAASDDPAYRRYAYNFARDAAETQLDAALLTDDPADRESRLRSAVEALRALETPENRQAFRELLEGLSPEQRAQVPYDREVTLSLGRAFFELGEFAQAREFFARLLADRAMGQPERTVVEAGVPRTEPNDAFWEVQLRFIRSTLESGGNRDAMARQLRRLQVIHGDDLGGRRWRRDFARLSEELLQE